ncbi:MFS transporter [Aquabacter sp. CN5-332]|uniref:MFS transporter n=1 Tax=Aquabacter sp. CN5-332 TaxID=3156608 RepID=UPI0032B55E2F
MLVAATLRAPIVGLAPMFGMIRETTGISAAEAGMLTTLPLIAFAVISPFAAVLARKHGMERSLFGALILIAFGVGLRATGPVWSLFLGTATLGAGIAIANVLLPSLLKRDFPTRIASLTGAYVLTTGLVAALASAVAVPLAELPGSGWHVALASTLIFPAIALIAWIPQLRLHSAPTKEMVAPPHGGPIWRSALAWQVTAFMSLSSLVYYLLVSWLPSILTEAGYSAGVAGSLHGVSQVATAVPGLILGPIVTRMKDQRAIALGVSLVATVSFLGLWLYPPLAIVWIALFGFGTGSTFILSLAFMSMRASSTRQAAALSGMAQCVGYCFAAAGPPLAGLIHDVTGSWDIMLASCVVLSLALGAFGVLAGRAAVV